MRAHLPAFTRHLASRRSPRTVATYAAIIAAFADATGDADLPARADVEGFLARPRADGRSRAPSTRNQELAALRAFAKFAVRDLGWSANPTDGIPFEREAPRDPPVLSVFELRRLFTTAAEIARSYERPRDLAILAVLGQAGLRVHELVALDIGQIDLASATIVGVRGKGGTMADLPVNGPTLALLVAWLGKRADLVPVGEPALFVSSHKTRLSVRSVQHLFVRLREAMGTAKRITPHTLRHTTATLALTMGAALSTVADLLRHADLNVTRRYLHLVDERRREAVRRLSVGIPEGLVPMPQATSGADPLGPMSSNTNLGMFDNMSGVVAPNEPLDVQHGLDDIATAA